MRRSEITAAMPDMPTRYVLDEARFPSAKPEIKNQEMIDHEQNAGNG
ncbi:MAG: hypothetical protein Q4D43_07180 [Clostridia bacterium]|nr:hypothetical protein [Clostridia bacterium]